MKMKKTIYKNILSMDQVVLREMFKLNMRNYDKCLINNLMM